MFKTSIRNKLIVLLLLITIIPFGSSVFVTFFYTKETLTEKAIEENSNLLYQGKINIENYLNELNSLTLTIYNNPDFMNHLAASDYRTDYMMRDVFSNVMLTILYANESIKKVTISNLNQNYQLTVSHRSNIVYSTMGMNKKLDVFTKAEESLNHLYIESNNHLFSNTNSLHSFTLHRAIANVPSPHILGYISLEVDPSKLSDLSKRLYHEPTESLDIVTPDGSVVFSSDERDYTEEEAPWKEELLASEDESGVLKRDDENFQGVIVYHRISKALGDWILIKRLPYTTLHQSAYDIGLINIGFGLIGLALVIIATFFVSFKITSPIRVLVQNIQQIEKNNIKVKFDSLGNDEIGILGERFKQMIERINHLINREFRLEIENKTNQLKVLQSQINPHFLYNALQSIGTLALKSNAPKVYSLITQLSKIMRYGMDMKEDKVPLDKEVQYIKSYLLLYQERLGDEFTYTLDFDSDVMDVMVPKMILQPFVENYFKHGFESSDDKVGYLHLEGKKEEDYLIICIHDNGKGMTREQIEAVNQSFLDETDIKDKERTNIGLKNVYDRLKLNYEERAKLQLQKRETGGLTVKIRLPLNDEGERYEVDNH
ncbi:sensor histidine kinase [Gracilibacillus sp. YIM 98692]|uniref:cache domain-containing sensor histidine kinase n=1 Tax=Gracilibacillus sp. YIM 98692 TaxID=2663532 RepID=UPI0013D7CC89|nr:sensor histidine kinase [Gracilibacillus sp. YIM 98692]